MSLPGAGLLPLTILLPLLLLGGCSRQENSPPQAGNNGPLIIVATIFPLADWASQVAGSRASVSVLLPAGSSPHTFDPSPADMQRVSKADLFLKVGLRMDDWGARLAVAGRKDLKVLSLGDLLLESGALPDVEHMVGEEPVSEHHTEAEGHHHHHEGVNPHFWLDPLLARASVEILRDTLIELDPENGAEYRENAREYISRLEAADQQFRQILQPCRGRSFVSFHNAFPYLARRYNLGIAAVIEEFPGKTPSERYIKQVTDTLRRLEIGTVFTEPQLNPRVAQIVANEVGARPDVLDPYGDASFAGRDTYLHLMQYNVSRLKAALCP